MDRIVMDEADWVAGQFEANRARLEGMAFRMLGSRAEAEDAVQEAWLRMARADPESVENLAGWLTTVTGRVCLDRLRRRTTRPEDLVGVSVGDVEDPVEHDPADAAILAESVGAALLVVLDSMAPEERVAFVLHDVFGVPFDTIGEVVGKSPQAARQLASRARRRVRGGPTVTSVDAVQHRTLVEAFLRAAREGDFEGLVRLLHPDVVFRPDQVSLGMGSRPEMQGAREVATAIGGGARGARLVTVDGRAALAWAPGGRLRTLIEFSVAGDQISAITVIGDPERLAELDIVMATD